MITIGRNMTRESPAGAAGARAPADGRPQQQQMYTARRGSHDSDDRRKHRGPAAPRSLGQRTTDDTDSRGGRDSRQPEARAAARGTARHRLLLCHAGRRRAGGRATSRPTSRWTPRTCCSVSSSASRTRPPRRPPACFIRGEQREDGTWATFYGGPGELSTTIEAYVALRLAGDAPDAPHMARAVRLDPRAGRHRRGPGLHPDLAGPVRLVEVGRPARTPAGAHLLPEVGPAQHLRLRLLGPADHRAAHRRLGEASGAARAVRARRAAHRPARPEPGQAARPAGQLGRRLPAARQGAAPLPQGRAAQAAQGRDEHRRPLDHRAAGERRLLGRHPAARRVLRHRPAPARLRPRPPGDARGAGVAGPLRRLARGRGPDDRGLPVAGVGHLPRDHRARRRGRARRPPAAGQGRRLDARRGDRPARATGRCAARNCRRAAGRSSSTTTTTPTSTTPPRSSSRCAGSGTPTRRGSRRPSRAGCAGTSACSRRTARGAPSTSTTPAPSPTGCRSATSARSSTRRPPTSPRTSWRCSRVEGLAHDPRTRRGIDWLLAEQEPNGAWFGRWGVNYVYGTGSVVPALAAAGLPAAHPAIRRAVALAGVRAERRRRLGRGPALLPRRHGVGRARRLDRLADRLGADGAARGRGAGRARPSSAASPGSPRPSGRTAPGTSRTSPAPASPGTSPSTTTCTARSSRSPRSAGTSTANRSPTGSGPGGQGELMSHGRPAPPPRC